MILPLRDQDRLQVIQWIRASYWGGWQQENQIRFALKHSLALGAYRPVDRMLLGFVRIVTDYATFSSITDLYVDESFRRQGVGRQVMEHVIDETCVSETICILASRDARGFYKKFGFEEIGGDVMKRNPTR
jgi:ribosomal protein S18 acetylase RimI-like enzyme